MCEKKEDQIVISGISGRYPESDDIYEFWEGIVNGVELNSSDDRRWPVGYIGLPKRCGKIKHVEKIDANFFQIDDQDAHYMDPQIRLLYETSYEAIIDAGVIPEELRGSKTALIIGLCYDDTSNITNDITQNEKNRVYAKKGPVAVLKAFGFTGPAFEVDTACASSFSAFHEGMTLMKAGHCDHLLVGGVACHLTPSIALGFMEMRMIAPDGRSKCLDAAVNGYCRSEAVITLFVQWKKNAKRIYASVTKCKTNADGFKPEGITFPGYKTQKVLLEETIKESGIDPLSINYIEAHVTGTAAGDPIESRAILDSYRGENEKPIMFGCLKSNIGHTEGASANCALTKVALIFQKHCIPPNLNYKNPNPNIDGLMNNRIIPVLKKTEFHDEIIPVNSFGFGGVNVHALLKANEKVVSADSYKIVEDIPRLVNMSGRTEEGLEYAMKWIERNRKDVTKDFLSLINDVSKSRLETGMNCRAFMIIDEKSVLQKRVIRGDKRRPLWFVFSALGCQWKAMAKELMTFDIFSNSIHKCANILKSKGIDLLDLLINENADLETNIISALVSIVSIQIALVDVMSMVGIKADGIIGHSIGEVVAGYTDGCLTLEEAVMTAYYIAKSSKKSHKETGAMAAIGLSWEEAKIRCPSDIHPACDNSIDSVTVSGPKQSIDDFINKLQSEKIFAKKVNSCEMAYHCPMVIASFDPLSYELEKVIQNPKMRSKRWISTSETKNGKGIFCNANYYANNVVSVVEFKKAINKVPEDACIVEVGPSAILLPMIKRCLPNSQIVKLMKRDNEQNLMNILAAIGEIYCSGNNVQIEKLYRKVEYPVPRETLSISHLLKWDHSKSYFVAKFHEYFSFSKNTMARTLDFMSKDLKFVEGHCIDGRNLFPATGYLYYVWNQYAIIKNGVNMFDVQVEFRNIKLHRATIVSNTSVTEISVTINISNGLFSVSEGGSVCVTGIINLVDDGSTHNIPMIEKENSDCLKLNTNEIYKELRVRGYDYGPSFQGLIEAYSDGSKGKVKWTGHWISFTDSMLHLSILGSSERVLRVPTFIEYMRCDPKELFKAVDKQETLDVYFDKETNVGFSNGVIIKGLNGTKIARKTDNQIARLMHQSFIPYNSTIKTDARRGSQNEEYFKNCTNLLKRLNSQNFEVSEDEEKSYFNNEENEEYGFYKKLIVALKEKQTFEDFCQSITNLEKLTVIFTSNKEEIIVTQFKQIIENMNQRMLNVLECNSTENKLKDTLTDVIDTYLLKYEFESLTTQLNSQGLPPSLTNLDLIVYKDANTELITDNTSLKSNEELLKLINSCHKALKVGGFLMFTFRTKMTEFEKALLTLRNISLFELDNEENIKNMALDAGLKIIAERSDDLGIVSIVFRNVSEDLKNQKNIQIETCAENYEWIELIKKEIKDEENEQRIWLLAKNEDFNGVIGLTRCLKKEPGGQRIRCFLSNEKTIPMDVLEKDLIMNVYKDETHGVFIFKDLHEELKELKHAYLDMKTKGDLSSFRLYEASHKNWNDLSKSDRKDKNIVNVYYGALNFKDVMVASGRITSDAYPIEWQLTGNLGIEYSGIDENGNRVMGICQVNTLATTLVTSKISPCWPVPASWTLEEAATVPVAYNTVYYALFIRAKLRPKEKVLIHAGSGGVGQAAITVCLSMDCEVFTTVGTQEKKEFLKELFPKLEDKHFANSRDLSFEEHILRETNGNGVDLIINSLAEEKLRASINCLADFGRFVEIGKYDIIQNNPFDSKQFERNQTFHTVCLAHLLSNSLVSKSDAARLEELYFMINKALERNEIKPLRRSVFKLSEAEKAFRFMASGKHIGKVLLQIREEEQSVVPKEVLVNSFAQTFCHPSKVYVLIGGLGGIGLELAFWLVNRRAEKLVITSRTGVKDNYQRYIIKSIEERGVKVEVLVNDSSTYETTLKLIEDSMKMGPIGGIFNLAMVLDDSLIVNQTQETFKKVCQPKIDATLFLDQITREKCPKLDYFVCFSSAACGRGNGGQSNYGYANSFMESICGKRRRDNLHGIAIQWGAVGDVGFFMDHFKGNDISSIIISGTVPQRIPSFMNSLDTLINYDYDVCSSAVYVSSGLSSSTQKGDLLKTICHVLGADPKTLENHTTLGDLGMDSLMAVEIKQALERDYNTVMSTQEIRQLTVQQIRDLSSKKVIKNSNTLTEEADYTSKFENPKELFKKLDNGNQGAPVFFIPPIEGDFKLMKPLADRITRPVIGINWIDEVDGLMSIEEVAAFYVQKLRETYLQPEYEIVSYSFGSLIAFEMCVQLQAIDERLVKKLYVLDGDIDFLKKTTRELCEKGYVENEKEAFQELLIGFITLIYPSEVSENLRKEIITLNTKDEQIKKTVEFINLLGYEKCTEELLKLAVQRSFDKLKLIYNYEPQKKFKGDVKLFVSTREETESLLNNSRFRKIIDGTIEMKEMTGDHRTFLADNYIEIGDILESHLLYLNA